MTAPPGDHLDFNVGSAAESGERAAPGVVAAFKAAYSTDPHRGAALREGVSSFRVDEPAATVFFARVDNKVAILLVKGPGFELSKVDLIYLVKLAGMLKKGGRK